MVTRRLRFLTSLPLPPPINRGNSSSWRGLGEKITRNFAPGISIIALDIIFGENQTGHRGRKIGNSFSTARKRERERERKRNFISSFENIPQTDEKNRISLNSPLLSLHLPPPPIPPRRVEQILTIKKVKKTRPENLLTI